MYKNGKDECYRNSLIGGGDLTIWKKKLESTCRMMGGENWR